MKIFDLIDYLRTRHTRAQHEVLISVQQGTSALALVYVGSAAHPFEVYNSEHLGENPLAHSQLAGALGYMFPRREMTAEQCRLRDLARGNFERLADPERSESAEVSPPPRVDLERLAIERLDALGTEHGAALAMEIQQGIDRRKGRLPRA